MAITYPLVAPASLKVATVRFTPRSVVGESRSPFTGQEQVYVHQGQWWEMDVQLLSGNRASAEDILGFLLKLNGKEGTFLFGPPDGHAPRGTATGTPIVSSGGQTGNILVTQGWTASLDNILKAGDWFHTGSGSNVHLYKNLDNVNTDGNGVASLTVWPKIRQTAPAQGTAITVNSAYGLWRLSSNQMPWDISDGVAYNISFGAVEALNP